MRWQAVRAVLLELEPASEQSRHQEEEDPVMRRMVHTVPVAYGLDHTHCAWRLHPLQEVLVVDPGLPSL